MAPQLTGRFPSLNGERDRQMSSSSLVLRDQSVWECGRYNLMARSMSWGCCGPIGFTSIFKKKLDTPITQQDGCSVDWGPDIGKAPAGHGHYIPMVRYFLAILLHSLLNMHQKVRRKASPLRSLAF